MSSDIDKVPVSSFENICNLIGISETTRMDKHKLLQDGSSSKKHLLLVHKYSLKSPCHCCLSDIRDIIFFTLSFLSCFNRSHETQRNGLNSFL